MPEGDTPGTGGVDDLVEVSGTVEENGAIAASFIEPQTNLNEYKVTGVTTGVTTTELNLNGLTVDYSSATLRDFDTGTIADGDVVEVKGTPADFSPPAQLTAAVDQAVAYWSATDHDAAAETVQ